LSPVARSKSSADLPPVMGGRFRAEIGICPKLFALITSGDLKSRG